MAIESAIQPTVPPSGNGCVECLNDGDWWLHLRRCAQCGHVGCCDSSPNQHATHHAADAGHPIAQSFEPGEEWFWNYVTGEFVEPVTLAEPSSHPADQSAPAPTDRVPGNWMDLLNAG